MDCAPVPVARGARAFHPGWLADIARIGKGGNDRYLLRFAPLVSGQSTRGGHGLDLAAGNVQDRWLAELLLSSRAGVTQLSGPGNHGSSGPPRTWFGPAQSCGRARSCPILADLAYRGDDWQQLWATDYAASSSPLPKGPPQGQQMVRQSTPSGRNSLCQSV